MTMTTINEDTPIDYEILSDYLEDKNLTDGTIYVYTRLIKRIMDKFFDTLTPTIEQVIKKKKDIYEYVETHPDFKTYNSRQTSFVAISHLFRSFGIDVTEYENLFRKLKNLQVAEKIEKKNKNEVIDTIDFEKMKENADRQTEPEKRLLAHLYSYLPPLRHQDYRDLQVYYQTPKNIDNTSNYVLMNDKLMVVNTHKTQKSIGTKKIKLPKIIIDEIENYIDETGDNVLFRGFTPSRMTKMLNRIFGTSSNNIRKAYISNVLNNSNISNKKRAEIADIMGHSITESVISYQKDNNNKHIDFDEID